VGRIGGVIVGIGAGEPHTIGEIAFNKHNALKVTINKTSMHIPDN
jgi:hypothetical protein